MLRPGDHNLSFLLSSSSVLTPPFTQVTTTGSFADMIRYSCSYLLSVLCSFFQLVGLSIFCHSSNYILDRCDNLVSCVVVLKPVFLSSLLICVMSRHRA